MALFESGDHNQGSKVVIFSFGDRDMAQSKSDRDRASATEFSFPGHVRHACCGLHSSRYLQQPSKGGCKVVVL